MRVSCAPPETLAPSVQLQICLIYEDHIGEYNLSTRLWLFILFQWIAFGIIVILRAGLSGTPESVTIQIKRAAFFEKKVHPCASLDDFFVSGCARFAKRDTLGGYMSHFMLIYTSIRVVCDTVVQTQ